MSSTAGSRPRAAGPSPADGLTAGSGAVPRRDPARLTLGDCWRSFIRRPSPPLLIASVAGALLLRLALWHFDWRDPVVIAGVLAITPPVEWLIHVTLLHARPFRLGGRRIDLLAAREHRAHHESPADLNGVLLPRYAVAIFVVQIALITWLVSFPVHAVLGGARLPHAATGLLVSLAVLAAYEWSHFLIHTPYRPRRRYYRAIWHGHRLHHYKNERYWFGVTSTVADRVLRTAPDHREVPRSPTARALGER